MCGIAGLVGRVDEAAVRRALDAESHRGPDDAGVFVDRTGVVLGHRRLAVVDLSPSGHQPMTSDDGAVTVVFNGEIYDHARLRDRLDGARFRGTSDTEVLLRTYERHGIDGTLARIDGMFAFAIWDARTRELHLARDGFGKKPLFHARTRGGLAFASTLPALLELLDASPDFRPESLVDLFTLTYVSGATSMFEGVEKLAPGSRLTLRDDGSTTIARFFEPRLGPFEARTETEMVDAIEASLDAAVKRRLVADVPLGAFLSGGIDSSLVVASMARSTSRVRTIAMGFEDESLDERPEARRVAERFGTDHTEIVLRPDALGCVPALVHASGEPLADHALLPTYLLAREAKRHVTVVLTGDGGDELFGGYESYRAVALARVFGALPLERISELATSLGTPRATRLGSRLALVASYRDASYRVDPTGVRGFRGRLESLLAPELLSRLGGYDPDRSHRRAAIAFADASPIDRAMNVDLVTQLPDDFLVKLDVATMAHGVEARSPFLDRALFALASRIPWTSKLGRGRTKHLLRRLAERRLPHDLTRRKKRGFSPPTGRWLMRDGGDATVRALLLSPGGLDERFVRTDVVHGLLEDHLSGVREHGQRLWALVIADAWIRTFVDRTLRPSDDLRAFARDLSPRSSAGTRVHR